MLTRPLIYAAIFLAFLLGGAVSLAYFSPPPPVLDFTLTDQDGRQVRARDFRGEALIIFFGFTGCSSICPTTLAQVDNVMTLLKESHYPLRGIFITIDPVQDTPEALKEYLTQFDSGILALTGAEENLAPVYKSFSVFTGRASLNSSPTGDHSGFIYLIDQTGKMRANYTLQTSPAEIAQSIVATLSTPISTSQE